MDLKSEQQTKEKTSELEGGIALNIQENTEKNKRANSPSFIKLDLHQMRREIIGQTITGNIAMNFSNLIKIIKPHILNVLFKLKGRWGWVGRD